MNPRPAATVIVARPAHGGVEVLVERRAEGSRFAPGFVVFPGGLLEPGDGALALKWFGGGAEALRACALRELHEETGLLLTASGLIQTRRESPVSEVPFEPPEPSALVEVGRWVAPEFLAVRFDASFFAIEAPAGVEPYPDGTEIDQAWWALPSDVVTASTRSEAPLMWPTLVSLERLAECASVEEVLAVRIDQIHPPPLGESGDLRGAWQRPEGSPAGPLQEP